MERRGRQDERYQSLRAMFYFMYHTKNVCLFTVNKTITLGPPRSVAESISYRSTSVARTAPSLYRTGSCPLCLWDGFTIAEYIVDKESGSMSFFWCCRGRSLVCRAPNHLLQTRTLHYCCENRGVMHPSSALCVVFATATRLPALAHWQRLIPRGHTYIYSPRLIKTWGICQYRRPVYIWGRWKVKRQLIR